jgi:hypothetical protein
MFAGRSADGRHGVPAIVADPVQDEGAVQFAALTIEVSVAAAPHEETQKAHDYVHVSIPAWSAASTSPAGAVHRQGNSLARVDPARFQQFAPARLNKVWPRGV